MIRENSYATLDADGQVPVGQLDNAAGASHPDLATHDTLGLATQAEFDAHATTTHAATQAAAEATAAAALSGHDVDTTSVHGIADTAALSTTVHDHDADYEAAGGIATHSADTTAVHGIADTSALSLTSHEHDADYEASGAVATHAGLSDPHPGYLTTAEGDAAYAHAHPYEPAGSVAAHEAAGNPHASYATDTDLTAHAAGPHGGGGAWTSVIKTADESKNTTAVVADDALLKFTTVANTQYVIRLRAFFLTNATADLKYRLVHTGTTTRVRRRVKRTATTDIAQTIELKTAFDAADVILATTGLNPWLEEDIILQVGAAGGVLKLQWSQVTSNAGPTTCLEGSYLEYALS